MHIDGDREYLNRCLEFYKKANVLAIGVYSPENEMSLNVEKYLEDINPDIVVITGHDSDVKNNSKYFSDAVKVCRKFQKDYDKLIIIAGACQSDYERLLKSGANFASSPKHINIHALDPAIIALSLSLLDKNKTVDLIPLLEKMENNLNKRYQDVTADAGYESEENYAYFENKKQKCYIKPQNYERSKTRKFKNNMALRENMEYDEKHDEYTCQNGRKLKAVYVGTRKSKSGFESEITYYECENCEGCPYKKSCTRAKGNRKISLSKKFIKQRKQSLENITSPMGILLRTNRSIQSEGAFGVIKENYKFRQFLLRGNEKVSTEITLLAIAYNINKYHHKIQDNRTGTQLHGKLSA